MNRIEMEIKVPGPRPDEMNILEFELKAVEDKGVWFMEMRFNGKCVREKVEHADANRRNTEADTFAFMLQTADHIRERVLSNLQ